MGDGSGNSSLSSFVDVWWSWLALVEIVLMVVGSVPVALLVSPVLKSASVVRSV